MNLLIVQKTGILQFFTFLKITFKKNQGYNRKIVSSITRKTLESDIEFY